MEFIEGNIRDFLKDPVGNINKFRWVNDETPFSSITFPIVCSFGYLIVIYVLQNIMKNRKEIKLHSFSLVHNLFLSGLSLLMFLGVIVPMATQSFPQGLFETLCRPIDSGLVSFSYYIFYLSKVYEFVDTIIQVLRKKKLMFLHVYHHFITLWLVWINLKMNTGVAWVDISANCFVHILMYYYYFETQRGNKPWWRKYITIVQIIQFVIDMGSHLIWHFYNITSTGIENQCAGTVGTSLFSDFVILSFLGLFIQFFISSYKSGNANSRKPVIEKKDN